MVSPLRILLVEDDPVLARSVARVLSRIGHQVTIADGCRKARDQAQSFDGAVLDLDLHDGNGVDLGNELIVSGAVEFIMFFTGSNDGAALERASLLGVVVSKADSAERLGQILDEKVADARRLALISRRRASGVLRAPTQALPNGNFSSRLASTGTKNNT